MEGEGGVNSCGQPDHEICGFFYDSPIVNGLYVWIWASSKCRKGREWGGDLKGNDLWFFNDPRDKPMTRRRTLVNTKTSFNKESVGLRCEENTFVTATSNWGVTLSIFGLFQWHTQQFASDVWGTSCWKWRQQYFYPIWAFSSEARKHNSSRNLLTVHLRLHLYARTDSVRLNYRD